MKAFEPVSSKEKNASSFQLNEENVSTIQRKGYEARTRYPHPSTKQKENDTVSTSSEKNDNHNNSVASATTPSESVFSELPAAQEVSVADLYVDLAERPASDINTLASTQESEVVAEGDPYQLKIADGKKITPNKLTGALHSNAASANPVVQRVETNFTPLTITAKGFQAAALLLSQNISDENVKNNARILVAIGTLMNIYDGNAQLLTNERPVNLTQRIELFNGVYKSMGNPPFFYKIYFNESGEISYTRSALTNTKTAEDVMLNDIVREGDRSLLNGILGSIPHWFLVLPGGVAAAGGQRSTPQWASQKTGNVLKSLKQKRATGDGTTTGSGKTPRPPVNDREIPDRIVPWTDERGVHANIWARGTHATVDLDENESQEHLEQRVRNITGALRDATDPSKSTGITNGSEETGFTEPTPESRPQKELPGSGKVTDPGQQRQAVINLSGSANWPAYPARINNYGADISVKGGNNRMAMEINYSIAGSDVLSGVTARMQHINYFWEIFDVTKVAVPGDIGSAVAGAGQEVGPGSGVASELYRSMYANYEDQRADLEAMTDAGAANIALWQLRAAQLSLMAVSASVRTIGSLVDSYVSIVTSPLNERNIGWDREGDFIVRCVATPSYEKGSPNRRASSVAVQPIRVVNVNTRAEQEVTREPRELANLKKRLESAKPGPDRDLLLAQIAAREKIRSQTTMENVGEQLRSAQQQLAYTEEIINLRKTGASPTTMSEGARLLRVQLELNGVDPQEFSDHIKQQLELLENMQRYGSRMVHGLKAPVYRPRVVLASEDNGQVSQMVMMLGETADSTDAKRKYRLVDLTSPNTQGSYDGESTQQGIAGHSQAIQNAFYQFRDKSEYGRGTMAIRLPENMPEGITVETSMRSKPGTGRRWVQRLADLAKVAEVAGLVLSGPAGVAVGMIGGVAGAAVAVDSLMRKKHSGRFRWNFATVMEITGVVGGVVPFLGLSKRFEKTVYYIGVAQLGQSALSIPIQLEEQLKSIEMNSSSNARGTKGATG